MAELVTRLDLYLVFVQEIADEDVFGEMLAMLPTHDGVLSPDHYSSGEYQKTGIIYRTDLIEISNTQTILSGDRYAFPRPPYQANVLVHRDGENLIFIAINAHLKAGTSEDDESRRRAACAKLKQHVDAMLVQDPATGILIVGDLNDAIDDPDHDNVFTAFLQDQQYLFLTESLAEEDAFSYIPWRRLIDHLLITSGLHDDYLDGHTRVLALEQQIHQYDFNEVISDHRPVVSFFPL